MMKGMMVTSNMRGRKNKASKAEGCKATRGPAFLLFRDLLHRAMPLGGRSASGHGAGAAQYWGCKTSAAQQENRDEDLLTMSV